MNPALNSQNINLFQAPLSPNVNPGRGGGDITIVGLALLSEAVANNATIDSADGLPLSDQISAYTVRKGDTLSEIASMYGVSVNTVMWANNLSSSVVSEGQNLVILPVSGVRHIVKKGDTLKSIALLYKADLGEIAQFNDIAESSKLALGQLVIVPDGEVVTPVKTKTASPTSTARGVGGPALTGYFVAPIYKAVISQGLHGYNAVDFAASQGTAIFSAAAGKVIVSRSSGWNGGYGKYIVITHPNGTQTLYAHLSEVLVTEGTQLDRGQLIGYSGNTGKSTGPHLHFEVRGAKNPFLR